jgi:ATP-dependent DNA helicase RecG
VLSATPIPRTLALVIYGDLDVSTMRGLPPGRLPVKTRIVPENKRMDMYAFIRQTVSKGERVYYICPLVEESDKTEAKSVQEMYDTLSKGALRGLNIGITYGTQNAEDKKKAISDFSLGKTSVLVATTVVEVGIDVPQATIIVIENADRFGLSQLHQLRGRVGRGKKQSWCFLLGERNERLAAMCETNDGFEIAEKDLEIRGPGEFLGTMQHGKATFSIMTGDMRLIEDAQNCAKQVILGSKKHEELISSALEKYSYAYDNIALN